MMHDGQVVAIGTPEEIKQSQNPLVRKFIYTTTKGIQGERE
jgi:phospholipid/cholesterol/gamma-HCH transport system ATP-binding protein